MRCSTWVDDIRSRPLVLLSWPSINPTSVLCRMWPLALAGCSRHLSLRGTLSLVHGLL